MSHWILALVAGPALAAGLILIGLRNSLYGQRLISLAATATWMLISVALLNAASVAPPEAYFLGNWPAPFGIVLVLDRLSALMLVLTNGLGLITLAYALTSGWDARGRHYHALFQFQLMGLNGAFLTADAFNLFVFFEVLLIASYGLLLHGGGRDRVRSGLHYVVINLVGSAIFLIALATVYAVTGTLNMADLAQKLSALPQGDFALMRVAAVLLFVVFAIKGALLPLHLWLPGTYADAPGVVAALFAIMTKVGAYATLRFGTLVFPPDLAVTEGLTRTLILPAALATLIVGALGVLGSRTMPRIAAFATLASMGTVFVAFAGFTPSTTAAGLYYLTHSVLAGAALFLIADLMTRGRAKAGLTAAFFMAAAIALAGLPPLSGFIGKLLILQSWTAAAPLVWTVILVSSFLTILGFARAGSGHFLKGQPQLSGSEPASHWIIGLMLAGLAALSIGAGPVLDWMTVTAQGLYDAGPYIAANRLGQGG